MKMFFAVLALVWAGSPCIAAEIGGRVLDPSGKPVASAPVALTNAATSSVKRADCSADGTYRFTGVTEGRYWLEVSVPGFSPLRTASFDVVGDVLRDLRLTLEGLPQSIVVSATRREELLLESAAPTTLIERPAIEDTAAQTLEQLLVEQAGSGVYVSRGFGIGFPQINGVGGNRVLLLVDGQRQIGTDNGTRDGVDLDQFTTERLDRVEVVKGAASALYGSDAMGGVINLVTRRPTKPFSLDLNNNAGSFGERNSSATLGLRRKRFGALLSGVYQDFDGYDLNKLDRATTGASGGENAFIDRNLSPTVFYDLRDNLKMRINSNYYRRNANFLNSQGAFAQSTTQERWNLSPSVEWGIDSRNFLTLRGDVSVARRFDLDRVERLTQFEATGSSLLHATNTLQYGVDLRSKWLRRQGLGSEASLVTALGPRGTRAIDVRSVWAQDEWRLLGGRLALAGGLRIEDNSQFGANTSPKLSAVYRLAAAHRLRFSYGRGFRAPDISELYSGFSPGAFGFVGNPELTPETSHGYTAGWTFAARRLQYSLDLFRNDFRNGIAFFQVNLSQPFTPFLNSIIPLLGPGQQLFTNRNLGDFSAKGLNSALTVSVAQGLEATFNYTLLERLSSTGVRQVGLGNVRNSAFTKLGWRRTVSVGQRKVALRTNIRGTIRGREPLGTTLASDRPADPRRVGQIQFVPAYATWDALAGAVIPLKGESASWEPFVSFANLGGFVPRGFEYADGIAVSHATSNPTLPVFREPGRTWKAGFILRFGR
jgi:outer membrane receptor for ferrienterochelin and colicins